jgi:hypothetical protein
LNKTLDAWRSHTMKSALQNTNFDKMLDNTKSDTQWKEGRKDPFDALEK